MNPAHNGLEQLADQAIESLTQLRGCSPPSPREVKRRRRAPLSCSLCRKRKIRCDKQLPCSACKTANLMGSCEYGDDLDNTETHRFWPNPPPPPPPPISPLQPTVQVESTHQRMCGRFPHASILLQADSRPKKCCSSKPQNNPKCNYAIEMLQKMRRRQCDTPIDPVFKPLLDLFPGQQYCEFLIDSFLKRVNLVHYCTCPESLRTDFNALWAAKQRIEEGQQFNARTYLNLPSIAVILLVFRLGRCSYPLDGWSPPNYCIKDGHRDNTYLGPELLEVAEACLNASQFFRCDGLKTMQALVLMKLDCLYSPDSEFSADGIDSVNLTGVILQLALSQGLHMDPSNFKTQPTMSLLLARPHEPSTSVVEPSNAKLWRILYGCALILDAKRNLETGIPLSLPTQGDCDVFFYRSDDEVGKTCSTVLEFRRAMLRFSALSGSIMTETSRPIMYRNGDLIKRLGRDLYRFGVEEVASLSQLREELGITKDDALAMAIGLEDYNNPDFSETSSETSSTTSTLHLIHKCRLFCLWSKLCIHYEMDTYDVTEEPLYQYRELCSRLGIEQDQAGVLTQSRVIYRMSSLITLLVWVSRQRTSSTSLATHSWYIMSLARSMMGLPLVGVITCWFRVAILAKQVCSLQGSRWDPQLLFQLITHAIGVLKDIDLHMHGLCVSFLKRARQDLHHVLDSMEGSHPAFLTSQFEFIDNITSGDNEGV